MFLREAVENSVIYRSFFSPGALQPIVRRAGRLFEPTILDTGGLIFGDIVRASLFSLREIVAHVFSFGRTGCVALLTTYIRAPFSVPHFFWTEGFV